MAKETLVRLTDDIDGGEAVEELTFALRGVQYEIDLSAKNVAAMEKALDKFISHGRKVTGSRSSSGRPARRSTSNGKEDLAAIRSWAKDNGFDVSTRGRIPTEVKRAFAAANG
jgi:hypothetical protein